MLCPLRAPNPARFRSGNHPGRVNRLADFTKNALGLAIIEHGAVLAVDSELVGLTCF
jgi:hypothetical protein